MLDERKAAILAALVEGHIATGAPVSSRAILDRSGLDCSSATIRNEMVVLERLGLVAQPHTSAGRIPTDRGYRYYVDHLSPDSLRVSTRGRIESFFGSVHAEFSRILRQTSELLSEITEYPAVVLGPGLRGHVVRDLHLLALDPDAVVLVVITESGRVHQAVLRPPRRVGPDEVAAAAAALGELIGRELSDEVTLIPVDGPPEVASLVKVTIGAIMESLDRGREIYVGGTSRMVDLWEDLASLHRVLALLEREATVLELLDDRAAGTSVRFGPEMHATEQDLAVVSATYLAAGARGRVGVLGPLRMDYKRSIRVVEEVSDALGDSLNH
ncbi:MAG TPA: heat-inducible transcriptional repressor HrcA [Acidimicrobiia bacterium]|nr:heat-inducible transcriptional repressor HrcA [Acidimicrobiia bacterium]